MHRINFITINYPSILIRLLVSDEVEMMYMNRFTAILNVSLCVVSLLGIAYSPSAMAQNESTDSTASITTQNKLPCSTADHRAFDFWFGVWDVTPVGQNQSSGINVISREHGGCVIREEYKTNNGYTGMSMSIYDAARKTWHQTWMGLDGNPLYTQGGLNDEGAMVLSNANWPGYVEGSPINRITWTPNEDGSVRQHWQASKDDGKTWSTVFDGLYIKQGE